MSVKHSLLALGLLLGTASGALGDEDGYATDDWPLFNYDLSGSRHNTGEHTLSRWNVSHLHQLWNVPTPAPVTGTPIVIGEKVFIGDWAGNFYRLREGDGKKDWTTTVLGPVSATALVRDDRVIFGDQLGIVYGVNRKTGTIEWQVQPNTHPLAAVFGAPTPIGRHVAIGIASNEEEAAGDPSYPCCSFRGSVVMLDPANGDIVWQTYFISDAEHAKGSSGAAVWSTPTYDEDSGLLYVTTGNNYSAPTNGLEDATIALDARTGAIRWVNQAVSGDVGNFGLPIAPDSDSDYGDSPQIYRLANGRKVVSAGNKNGAYYVMDAATGKLVGAKQVQTGGSLGGLFADSAHAYGLNFANGADWADPFDFTVLPRGGYVSAISGDGLHVLWQKFTPESVNLSGVAVANEVVYFASCNPGVGDRLTSSGTLYAVGAFAGEQLAAIPVDKCASSGPAIAHGRVFMGTGNEFLFAGVPTGNIISFGL